MYLGAILMFIGSPLLLGSFYGLLTGLALTILLMTRIIGEEMMLVHKLEGYREYTQTVHYRLIPFSDNSSPPDGPIYFPLACKE
jgi:protein-S-isoprenylcysteine O-methyltransferase Ste14